MRLRGLHDIKTHGTLAQKGLLVSVARDLHKFGSQKSEGENILGDWSVERHVFKKKRSARTSSPIVVPLRYDLKEKIRLYQIEVIRDLLQEMHQAIAEGILVVHGEVERLEKRLIELESG